MMYATPADLTTRFGAEELAQILHPITDPDAKTKRLQAACEDAAALANGYLRRVCPLPLATTPPELLAITADIARYRLHDDGDEERKTPQRTRYDDAIKWLEDVASGKIQLFASEGADVPITAPHALTSGARIAVVSSPVVFNDQTLEKMNGATR